MDKAHIAFRAKVCLGILFGEEFLLRRFHRREDRGRPIVGAVDADAEVDLVGARVRIVELDEREKRVGGLLSQAV